MPTEAQILSQVMDKTRYITNYYLDKLSGTDLNRVFEVNGIRLNSTFWIMAHLPVTQNFLMLRSTGVAHVKIPWARQFGVGSEPPSPDNYPPLDEVKAFYKEVHEKSLAHVSSLPDEQLDQPNLTGFEYMAIKSFRDVIVHAIRHEGSHSGHLGWLCKIQGIKTM